MTQRQNENSKFDCLFVVALLLAALVFGSLKYQLFDGLHYASDIYGQMQSARSWWYGYPLLYNADFLENSHTHNYGVLLLLGPLVALAGFWGVIIPHLLLSLWAAWDLHGALRRGKCSAITSATLSLSVLFGPTAFWLYDDPLYGWHSELLFFPLLILLGVSASRIKSFDHRDRTQSRGFGKLPTRYWWLASLVILLREEGAVLAGTVHAVALYSHIRTLGGSNREFLIRVCFVGIPYALLFLAGMALLAGQPGMGQGRLSSAIGNLLESTQGAGAFILRANLRDALMLMIPFGAALFMGGVRMGSIGLAVFATLPLWAINLVASAAYLSDAQNFMVHGLTWPPRMAPLLGLFVAAIIAGRQAAGANESGGLMARPWVTAVIAAVLCWGGGAWSLASARGYWIDERIQTALSEKGPVELLTRREVRTLRCLGDKLSPREGVVVGGLLVRYFHRHFHVGFDKFDRVLPALGLMVCDTDDRLPFQGSCDAALESGDRGGWTRMMASRYLELRVRPDIAEFLRPCVEIDGNLPERATRDR